MADYTKSFKGNRATFPAQAIDAHELKRVEPLLTPSLLRSRVLFGVPLYSDAADPVTKKRSVLTDEHLKDIILGAISKLEADAHIDIAPVQRRENQPFDRNTFMQWGYLKTNYSPITSVESITIKPADNLGLYQLPLDWLSSAGFNVGKINVVPITPIGSTSSFALSSAGQGTGAAFLAVMGAFSFIPNFWEIVYTTGFPDAAVPRIVNELIGCYAAQEILAMLAATNTTSSRSLSHDGYSQSVASGGPNRYDARIKTLEDTKKKLLGRLKALFGRSIILSEI